MKGLSPVPGFCANIKGLKHFKVLCKMCIKFPTELPHGSLFSPLENHSFTHLWTKIHSLPASQTLRIHIMPKMLPSYCTGRSDQLNLLEPEKREGTGVRSNHYNQGKQAEIASPGCGITQRLSRVFFSQREFESHQEDLGRKRLDPCGSCFKKIASLITSEWTVKNICF